MLDYFYNPTTVATCPSQRKGGDSGSLTNTTEMNHKKISAIARLVEAIAKLYEATKDFWNF